MNLKLGPFKIEFGIYFMLMIVVLLASYLFQGFTVAILINAIINIICLISAVLLHEMGHGLAAIKLKILKQVDIVFWSLGAATKIPMQDLSAKKIIGIAAAGPSTNLVLALIFLPLILISSTTGGTIIINTYLVSLINSFFVYNLILGLFNLLPAIPMDGGWIFKSILELLNVKNINKIVLLTSKVIAGLMIIFAFYTWNPILFIIGIMILINGYQFKRMNAA